MKRIGLAPLLVLMLAPPMSAQFSGVVADAAGTRVWFTANRQLRGVSGAARSTIYAASEAGVAVFAEAAPGGDAYFGQISDNGDVALWIQIGSGAGGMGPQVAGQIRPVAFHIRRASDGKEWELSSARMSRNGRWVWRTNDAMDLETGARFEHYPAYVQGAEVADDGTAVVQWGEERGLLSPGGMLRRIPRAERWWGALLDRTARTLIWNPGGEWGDGGPLRLLDTVTGEMRTLASDCPRCAALQLSGDGRWLLLSAGLWTEPLSYWLLDTASKETTWLAEAGPLSSASLTSDGRTLCHSGSEGMVRCLDIARGETRTLVAKTAEARWTSSPEGYYAAPGGRYTLYGSGLDGARVTINGAPAKVQRSSDSELAIVIPVEAEAGDAVIEVDQPGSPFEPARLRQELREVAPRVIRLGEIAGVAREQQHLPYLENGTRGGLAGEMAPLVAGEAVWIHMTGLGREPRELSWLWGASLVSAGTPITPEEITYEDGWYTVKVRIPAGAEAVVARIGCVTSNDARRPVYWVEIPLGATTSSDSGR